MSMTKSIIYLDQLFVSNFAKAEYVPGWPDDQKEYYLQLLQALRTQVSNNRLACPTSPFHQQEAEQGKRVKDHVWHIVDRLSRGLSFNSYNQIHFSQLASAAYKFSGKADDIVRDWSVAFNQDPHDPVESSFDDSEILVHLGLGDELLDYNRETTRLSADVYGGFKQNRMGLSSTFKDEVFGLKMQLLAETVLSPLDLIKAYPELEGDISNLGAIGVLENQARLIAVFRSCGVLDNYIKTREVLNSKELLGCPLLHIRASLMEVDIINYPEMVPSPSLGTDFEIVSSILPYVDILATDNHMAELIKQGGLSETFSAKVYSMNSKSELLEEIENI